MAEMQRLSNYKTTEEEPETGLLHRQQVTQVQGVSKRVALLLVALVVALVVALIAVTATSTFDPNNGLWQAMGLVEEEDCIDNEHLIAAIFPTILNECYGCDIDELCNTFNIGSTTGCVEGWVKIDRWWLDCEDCEGGVEEGARITLNVTGFPPNTVHAWHIHESADATGGDGFTLGGHFNPWLEDHGCPDENGTHRHVGDLGNLVSDENGMMIGEFYFDMIRFWGEASINGRSILFFQDPDECTTMAAGYRWGFGILGACDEDCQAKFDLNSTVGDCFPEDWDCGDGVDFPYPCCSGLKCVIEDEEEEVGTCEIDPGM